MSMIPNERAVCVKNAKPRTTLKLWAIIVLIFLFNVNAYSNYTVVGCVSDDTGYLYTNATGLTSPRGSWYGPAFETTPVVTSGQLGYGAYCRPVDLGNCVIRSKTRCSQCTGPYDYNAGWGTDYYYEQAGQLTGYVMCPLDDYLGFIIVPAALMGFVFLRKSLVSS